MLVSRDCFFFEAKRGKRTNFIPDFAGRSYFPCHCSLDVLVGSVNGLSINNGTAGKAAVGEADSQPGGH